MSVLPKDSIKIIAECVGINNLNDEIATQLASDVEYRIREIVQESIKFMKHSKREYLSTEDINNALKLRNIEVLYGYGNCEPYKFSKVQSTTQAIYFVHDRELLFQDIVAQPLPKCPREPSLSAHWLALEGVQPQIPQNPPQSQIQQLEDTNNQVKRQKLDHNQSSNINNSSNQQIETANGGSSGSNGNGTNQETTQNELNDMVTVKPTVKHVLSKEIQMFYEKVVQAVKDLDSPDSQMLFEALLLKLKKEASLNQLLPYITNFIALQVTQNLTNLELLTRLMRVSRSLLESPHLRTELYLHQLMPPIMTCLLGRKLCQSSSDNHWKLRDYVAELLVLICKKFGDAYGSLQGRITRTLVQSLHDTSKSLPTHYGAIVGLSALGRNVVQSLIIPYTVQYYKLLEPELNNPSNQAKSLEIDRVLNLLISVIGKHFAWLQQGENILSILDIKKDKIPTSFDRETVMGVLQNQFKDIFEIFNEKLLVYLNVGTIN